MCEDPGFRLNDEDKIIFINTLTGNIIKEFDPVCPFVWDLEFTHDDNFLIFLGYGDTALRGFYRLNLKTLKETLLFTTEWLSNEEWYIVCDLYLFNLKENWILC